MSRYDSYTTCIAHLAQAESCAARAGESRTATALAAFVTPPLETVRESGVEITNVDVRSALISEWLSDVALMTGDERAVGHYRDASAGDDKLGWRDLTAAHEPETSLIRLAVGRYIAATAETSLEDAI